jgi:acetyl esterase/lipase
MPVDSKHLVDPELWPLLEFFPPLELTNELLPTLRALQPPRPPVAAASLIAAEVSYHRIPGPPGAPEVNVVLHVPRTTGRKPCVLHLHGGGFVLGSASSMQSAYQKMAAAAGCIIVSVDYRLAPETRYPGALHDCYAALTWVHAEAHSLGIDTTRVGVMGESAGGGLAAALALLARDRGKHPLAFQQLIYPMLDDRTAARIEAHRFAGEFLWTAAHNAFSWAALLGQAPGSPGVSAYAAPARAEDLSGLPPAYIATGALDLFIEEDLEFARRLMRQGVPVELHIYPGAFHGFDLSPDAQVAQDARRDRLAALKRALRTA